MASNFSIARSRVGTYLDDRNKRLGNVGGENYDVATMNVGLGSGFTPMSQFGTGYGSGGLAGQEILLGGIGHRESLTDAKERHAFNIDQYETAMRDSFDTRKKEYERQLAKQKAANRKSLFGSWAGTLAGAATSFIPGAQWAAPIVSKGVSAVLS